MYEFLERLIALRFQELETLEAYHLNLLMEEVIIILELKSKLFLLKSTMIKSNQYEE